MFPFQKSQVVSVMVPFPMARDADASRITHIFPIAGEILRVFILLTFTPLMRRITSPNLGFTEICFDIERGSTSIFPLLFLLPEITSRNTV